MKKMSIVVTGILLFSLISVSSAFAINVDINGEILHRENITEDTGWTVIDLSQYSPYEAGIRSIYVGILTGMRSSCAGDGIVISIRPFNDDANMRVQLLTSLRDEPSNTDNSMLYVWLPWQSSNRMEYKVEDLLCTEMDLRLFIVGYDT